MSESSPVWNRTAILARIREVLDPAEFDLLEQRLAGEIDGAQDAWLADVIEAAVTLPLPAAPEALSERLRSMFVARQERRRVNAVLVNDSRLERRLEGVRGTDDSDGWTLSYSADVANLLIDVWPNGQSFDIEAQLMSATTRAQFSMHMIGDNVYEASSDRLGRASVDDVSPGTYELIIARSDHDVVATVELGRS